MRRSGALRLVLVGAVCLLAWWPTAASADNRAIDASPRPGTTVELEPSRVTVAFAETIPAESATIVVRDASGRDVTNRDHRVEANNLYADLPYPLPAGLYTVHYRALDGSIPFGGSFQFAWDSSAQPRGQTTWRSAPDIPEVVELPGDAELIEQARAGTARPGDDASAGADSDDAPNDDETDGSAGGADSGSASDDAREAAAGDQDSGAWASPWWLVLLLPVAGGAWWLARRRAAAAAGPSTTE